MWILDIWQTISFLAATWITTDNTHKYYCGQNTATNHAQFHHIFIGGTTQMDGL